MAVSFEVRSSFLDEHVLDFTCRTGLEEYALGAREACAPHAAGALSRSANFRRFEQRSRLLDRRMAEWRLETGVAGINVGRAFARRSVCGAPAYVANMRAKHHSRRRHYWRELHALITWEVFREK